MKEIAKEFKIKYDFNQFAITICKSLDFWCEKVYFYDAPPYQAPNSKTDFERFSNYKKFTNFLTKIGIVVIEGRCQKLKKIDPITGKQTIEYNQKGVDTLITMDLMNEPFIQNIENIILLACDTDFVPIINFIRSKDKKIYLFYYNDHQRGSKFSMSNEIENICDKKILITKEHFTRSTKQ